MHYPEYINRFIPDKLWIYWDLFWAARSKKIDFDKDYDLKDFLKTQNLSLWYIKNYFQQNNISEQDRKDIESDFLNILWDPDIKNVSLNELFCYKYLPKYIPDGEYFQITITQNDGTLTTLPNGCGWSIFQRNIEPTPELCKAESWGKDRKIHNGVTASFWYDEGQWSSWDSYGLKKEYSPGSVLVMHNFYWYSDGTSLPVETNYHFLDWKNNGHNEHLLRWWIKFEVVSWDDTSEGKMNYEQIVSLNNRSHHVQKLCLWYEDYCDNAILGIRKCRDIIASDINTSEREAERENTYWLKRPHKSITHESENTAKKTIQILEIFSRSNPTKKRKNNIRNHLHNHVKNQMLIIAELIWNIETYLGDYPDASPKEIVSKLISQEIQNQITPEQGNAIYSAITQLCDTQKNIQKNRVAINQDPEWFIRRTFEIKENFPEWKIYVEVWIWVVQIYTETYQDYLSLVKDPVLAKNSQWVALAAKNGINFNVIKTSSIPLKSLQSSTVVHENRHQTNKYSMVENIFPYIDSPKWKSERFIHRAKDEIIAQFKWWNKNLREIISAMTQDSWLYNYFYHEIRLQKILFLNQQLRDIKSFFGPQNDLLKMFDIEAGNNFYSSEDFKKEWEKIWNMITFLIDQEDGESDKYNEIQKDLEEYKSNIIHMWDIVYDVDAWKEHKILIKKYCPQAHKIIRKYWDNAYHLLAITPVKQWKLFI